MMKYQFMRIIEIHDEERRRKKESGSTDFSSFPHSFPQGILHEYSEIHAHISLKFSLFLRRRLPRPVSI